MFSSVNTFFSEEGGEGKGGQRFSDNQGPQYEQQGGQKVKKQKIKTIKRSRGVRFYAKE